MVSRIDDRRHNGNEPPEHSFPIQEDVSYRCRKRAAAISGKTVYMSSREIKFTTGRPLDLGQSVEVAVNWPVLLHGTCEMKLVIAGHVIWSDSRAAAVSVEHYEFRTRSKLTVV